MTPLSQKKALPHMGDQLGALDVHANEPMEELPEHLIHNGLED